MKNIYLSLVVVLLLSTQLHGQSQIIFNKEETQNFLIKYRQGDNSFKHHIFNKLASGYNKHVSNVEFTFSFKQKRQILKLGNNLQFKVDMNDISVSGDILYKDFNVGEALIPGKVSFTLQWLRGNQILNSYTFNNVIISGENVSLVNMNVTDTLNLSGYKIKLVNKVFDYTLSNKQLFDESTGIIDDYYAENIRARNKLRYITGVNADRDYLIHSENFNDLYRYRDSANSALAYVKNVKQKAFYKTLPLNENDPKGIKTKLNKIKNTAERLKTVCTEILDNLDEVYYDKGIEMLTMHKPNQADYFFNKSIEFNPQFAPSHFQLARLYYNGGYIDKAVNKVFEIRGMSPDPETKMQTVELAEGIYSDFLLDAGLLNSEGNYDEAINILYRARDICMNFPEVQCRSNMDIEMSRAVNGKYNMILNDIDLSIRNNNLQEAESIIKEALNFAEQNRTFIPNNNDAAERISDLYFEYIDRAKQLNLNNRFENALAELDQASRICNSYNEINCSEDLNREYKNSHTGVYNNYLYDAEQNFRSGNNLNAETIVEKAKSYRIQHNLDQDQKEDRLFLDIKQAVYTDLIEDGRSLNSGGNYRESLNKYDLAIDIERNYSIRKNTNLNSYVKSSAKSLIFAVLDEGSRKVAVNNLSAARSLYSEAKDLSSKYGLTSETSVSSAINELKGKIFQQECLNAQNQYNDIYQQALNLIAAKDFIAADNKINDALAHADQNYQCELDTREAKDKKNYISQAVMYSKKLLATNDFIKRRNYKSAIVEYQNAESYFNINKVNRFGVSHKALFDFIREGYTDFVVYSVGFYNHNKEFDKAVELLRELSRRGAKNKSSRDVQTVLGTDLATRDFNENPSGNYKTNIARYAGGDKFFKYFMKAYKKQWKRLD